MAFHITVPRIIMWSGQAIKFLVVGVPKTIKREVPYLRQVLIKEGKFLYGSAKNHQSRSAQIKRPNMTNKKLKGKFSITVKRPNMTKIPNQLKHALHN